MSFLNRNQSLRNNVHKDKPSLTKYAGNSKANWGDQFCYLLTLCSPKSNTIAVIIWLCSILYFMTISAMKDDAIYACALCLGFKFIIGPHTLPKCSVMLLRGGLYLQTIIHCVTHYNKSVAFFFFFLNTHNGVTPELSHLPDPHGGQQGLPDIQFKHVANHNLHGRPHHFAVIYHRTIIVT